MRITNEGSSRRGLLGRLFAAALLSATGALSPAMAQDVSLRYGHMNSPGSIAGQQAQWLADAIAEKTDGSIAIQVFPSSQLGKLQELAEGVSTGTIALSHNTAGAVGSLYPPFAALDTPYLYRDVDHLMKTMAPDSPVMEKLNEGLIEAAGVRVLYAYYFGTRHLTADRAVKTPDDLSGVKIRAIPFPIYMTAVEGLGAVPVPVDWSEVPTALATGVVQGQENPINVIWNHKIFEVQSHLMQTGHVQSAQVILINEDTWQSLSPEQREAIQEAALEVRERATTLMLDSEQSELNSLKEAGMTVIGPDEGLDIDAFRTSVKELVSKNFEAEHGELYELIDGIN